MDTLAAGLENRRAETLYERNTKASQTSLLFHYVFHTLPRVKKQLRYWQSEAGRCRDKELKVQALSSIENKDFHCMGGAVYAVPYRKYGQSEELLIRLIVAYQTLCDYLDNLCDRANCLDGKAFRELHESLKDALTPGADFHDYYQTYPYQDDDGYINKLIMECQTCIARLPSYNLVYEDIIRVQQLYIDLQVEKHIDLDSREDALINWARDNMLKYPELKWQEFAAASGSTLAVFALFGLACSKKCSKKDSAAVVETYFPWICGLHILLDYFIDQAEDRQGGDLNFIFYYRDEEEMLERMKLFIRQSHSNASSLQDPAFEKTVIEGLLATYLSDKKVKSQGYEKYARQMLNQSGSGARITYRLCSIVRKF